MPIIRFIALFIFLASGGAIHAQNNPFGLGWELQADVSSLQFQSIKKQSVVESSSFATITGGVDETGLGTINILLDSVDTKIDLRNVRMRFLFFETFIHPEAVITMNIAASDVSDLAETRRKTLRLPYKMTLHGITKELEADLTLTLIGEDLLAVSTSVPITISVADFDLTGGLEKLKEAAKVEIVPSTTVTFDFVFKRIAGDAPAVVAENTAPAKPASVALETEGDFSLEACIGRFEILSRTGNIYFGPGSSRLDHKSTPLLDSVVDIVARCPDLIIQVAGHTDSKGSNAANQILSESRAASVANYLTRKGISSRRIMSIGFGEGQPVAANDTRQGRSKNRRIEFGVVNN